MAHAHRPWIAAVALTSLLLATGCAGGLPPPAEYTSASPEARAEWAGLAEKAVSSDSGVAHPAIAALRAAGPAGLTALFERWPDAIAELASARAGAVSHTDGSRFPDPERLRHALDGVARQRDAHASRLYWYTDLDEAVRVARAAHKPILSLRLLGDLDQELSCANSRFFRTTLYPEPRIGELLRRGFVLHWQSERPAPRITIDFGDGRRMERTLTGNSVHYILDEDGHPVDALPGLYGPAAFVRGLGEARAAAVGAMERGGAARAAYLRAYHARARTAVEAAWAAELTAMGIPTAPPPPVLVQSPSAAPPAMLAANTAPAKAAAEAPVVAALQGRVLPLPTPVSDEVWSRLLARHAGDARLDAHSRALMRRKIAAEVDPSGTRMVPLDDASFERRVAAFERVLVEDTVRNELTMHRTLHAWMSQPGAPEDLEALNRAVYASLFLTPRQDPWLGLLVEDGYTAIDREGLVIGPSAARPR